MSSESSDELTHVGATWSQTGDVWWTPATDEHHVYEYDEYDEHDDGYYDDDDDDDQNEEGILIIIIVSSEPYDQPTEAFSASSTIYI